MSNQRKFFGKKNLMRKCLICKGPNPIRSVNDNPYCEVCLTKRCCVCGKIKLFQVRLVEIDGLEKPICPRHFGAYQRFRTAILNPKWLCDEEFKSYIDRLKMDRMQQVVELKRASGEVYQIPLADDIDAAIERMFDDSGNKKKE